MKALLILALALVLQAVPAFAAPEIGKPAPEFAGEYSKGKSPTSTLKAFKGKIIVLEWTNPECPYVKKHYDSGNMQKLQEEYTGKGVVWLTINSSADGKQGNLTRDEANAYIEEKGAKQTGYILNPKGEIGHLYAAKTTPHMFIIDKEGILVYEGAIDDNDSNDAKDIPDSKNYVAAALDSLMAGKPVETTQTKPYGCGVKY